MTEQNEALNPLPEFDTIANRLLEEGALTLSPSELHGLICGQLAAGARFDTDTLLKVLAGLMDVASFKQEASKSAFIDLYQGTLERYLAANFGLELLLPEDDQLLTQRAEALGSWCAGFLSGFGLHVGKQGEKLSVEAQESLGDLSQIAQIAADTDMDSDEDESDLMEVQEYVRMAAMLLFSECNRDIDTTDKPEAAPTLH